MYLTCARYIGYLRYGGLAGAGHVTGVRAPAARYSGKSNEIEAFSAIFSQPNPFRRHGISLDGRKVCDG